MGAPPNVPLANQTAYEYTTTKSTFTINVDDLVQVTATFLSPITPDDFKRQSLVFSYLNVDVKSLDGNEHAVQLYTDISAGACCQPKFTLGYINVSGRVDFWQPRQHCPMGIWDHWECCIPQGLPSDAASVF
jgi:hypothetical protein